MSTLREGVRSAAQLIEWGLRVQRRPAQEPAYLELIRQYEEDGELRALVRDMASGLGLCVLHVSEHGIVLGPTVGSPFALRPAEFRPSRSGADDRLIDGLVQVAIATVLFPRPSDLAEEAAYVRPPVSVEEVDATLRGICERLAQAVHGQPDPSQSDINRGLVEAWRAYQRRASVGETKDGRMPHGTTHKAIADNLERLSDFGCFTRIQRGGKMMYQATLRYNVLVKELSASLLYQRIRELIGSKSVEAR